MILPTIALLLAAQIAASASTNEVKAALSRAEALYFEARFSESIEELTRAREILDNKPERLQERINTDLQLALAHIGMNDPVSAKTFLSEIYVLKPEFSMDERQFSPKVLALADQAKVEAQQERCRIANTDARKKLNSEDIRGLRELKKTMGSKCADLSSVDIEAADLSYKDGLAEYKRGNFSTALQSFQFALELSPKHDLAGQYLDLTQTKLQLDQDRLLLQWQKNFETRQFPQAGANYRQLLALNGGADSSNLSRLRGEYRKALSSIVDSWERSCAQGSPSDISAVRSQISELIPEPSFGDDLRAKVVPCPPKPAAAQPEPRMAAAVASTPPQPAKAPSANLPAAPSTECISMEGPLAMLRVKTRVQPQVTREMMTFLQSSQTTVRTKIRIDETGSVNVLSTVGANPMFGSAVKAAVSQWKFNPTRDQNGVRCVETELPIVFSRQ